MGLQRAQKHGSHSRKEHVLYRQNSCREKSRPRIGSFLIGIPREFLRIRHKMRAAGEGPAIDR
eukprot:4619471-Amphidinium_carterae.1